LILASIMRRAGAEGGQWSGRRGFHHVPGTLRGRLAVVRGSAEGGILRAVYTCVAMRLIRPRSGAVG
jgi:hypothetical protein